MDRVLRLAVLDLVLLVVVGQGHSRDLHLAPLVDKLASFLQGERRPLLQNLRVQDVCEVVLAHLALLVDDLLLGFEPSLQSKSAQDSYYTVILQP